MKPANFPARKRLRRNRAIARRAGMELPPRGYDHGEAATLAECLSVATGLEVGDAAA